MLNPEIAPKEQTGVQKALFALAVRVLRPLVRILLRHGMSFPEFSDIARWVFVDAAMQGQEFTLPGRKLSKARVAVLTGLSRKEVLRLHRLPSPEKAPELTSYNRAALVVSGWTENPYFSDGKDNPRVLSIKDESPSFADLVYQYSGDMPHKAVLDELVRSGSVELLEGKRVRLSNFTYVPKGGSDEEIDIVRTCASDLLMTMEHNFRGNDQVKFPQQEVYTSRLPEEALPQVRAYIRKETEALARRVHHHIYELSDNVAEPNDEHHRVGLGLYYFED